jgi:hypothetical protein
MTVDTYNNNKRYLLQEIHQGGFSSSSMLKARDGKKARRKGEEDK